VALLPLAGRRPREVERELEGRALAAEAAAPRDEALKTGSASDGSLNFFEYCCLAKSRERSLSFWEREAPLVEGRASSIKASFATPNPNGRM
jgi:hypothetical protein